jgi:hypothetical protein
MHVVLEWNKLLARMLVIVFLVSSIDTNGNPVSGVVNALWQSV